jgi:DtxR family Mn-dependent transcriptional regulator
VTSEAIQDFLKAVYMLQQESERVQTSMLAETLGITAPSTTEMAKKLAKAGLVEHEPYRGIRLTPAGERIALAVVRNHRLLEQFLVQALGFSPDEVHDEAERLEHVVSPRFIQKVADYLGNPRYDPHGDPIPGPEGSVVHRDLTPLTEWPLHTPGIIARQAEQTPDLLRYLEEKSLIVGAQVEVTARAPFDEPIHLLVNGAPQVIGANVAQHILVAAVNAGG